MIVGSEFPGDGNQTLKHIQHDLYSGLVGYLYHYARERYLKAAGFVGVDTELARILRDKPSFDHRVLQGAHDQIAAFYRFAHDDGGQIPLGIGPQEYEDLLRQRWSGFLHPEARNLAEVDAISHAVLAVVAYQNTEKGYACERQLADLLRQRYGDFSATQSSG